MMRRYIVSRTVITAGLPSKRSTPHPQSVCNGDFLEASSERPGPPKQDGLNCMRFCVWWVLVREFFSEYSTFPSIKFQAPSNSPPTRLLPTAPVSSAYMHLPLHASLQTCAPPSIFGASIPRGCAVLSQVLIAIQDSRPEIVHFRM